MYLDVTLSNGSGIFNRRKTISAKCVLDITLNPGLTGTSLDRLDQFNKVFSIRNRRRRKSSDYFSRKKVAKKDSSCASYIHHSLAAIETEVSDRLSVTCSVDDIFCETENEEHAGYVASWAVSFERLLQDAGGLAVFTSFLKQEFSDENIMFWRSCEQYKSLIDPDQRKAVAREIYTRHILETSFYAVNIDQIARQQVEYEMDNPDIHTFDHPQKEVFKLMKQDSYRRFLKSELYKTYLMREMSLEPLGLPKDDFQGVLSDKELKKANKRSNKVRGQDGNESLKCKRRSLLPWKSKSHKQNMKVKSDSDLKKNNCKSIGMKSTSDSDLKRHDCSLASSVTMETDVKNTTSTRTVLGTDLYTSHKEICSNAKQVAMETEDGCRFCRVILPDGSMTVVYVMPGQTIKTVMSNLCDKCSLSFSDIDVFLVGSEKSLDLREDSATLQDKEVMFEKRTLFRLDLATGKSIGVKARPHHSIRNVLKPVLRKHGVRLNEVCVQMHSPVGIVDINLDAKVSTIDSQHIVTDHREEESVTHVQKSRRRSSFFGFISGRRESTKTERTLLESDF